MKKSTKKFKSKSVLFARIVVYLTGFVAFVACAFLLPELAREESVGKPTDVTLPFLTISYILATPFFVALYHAHKLLNYIDKNVAFSNHSVTTLRAIKRCAVVFTVLVAVVVVGGVVWLRLLAPQEDTPPFILFGFSLFFISTVITVFIAVLQKLLTEAVNMKSDNDLII